MKKQIVEAWKLVEVFPAAWEDPQDIRIVRFSDGTGNVKVDGDYLFSDGVAFEAEPATYLAATGHYRIHTLDPKRA